MLEMTLSTFKPLSRRQPALQNQPTTLVSYTVPWAGASLINFVRHVANSPRFFWESDQLPLSFAGCGIAARLTAAGAKRFQTIRQEAERLFENIILLNPNTPTEAGPRLFGGFAFGANHRSRGFWSAFPAACFILPRYQLANLHGQSWLTVNHLLNPQDDPLSLQRLLDDEIEALRSAVRQVNQEQPVAPNPVVNINELTQAQTWQRLITETTARIRRGELEKVVLARARQMSLQRPVDPAHALQQLKQAYPNCYRFLFEPIPGHAFFGATPELLAQVSGNSLRTVALAGSIRRGESPAEDDALGQKLLSTPKERHEHALVVEAIEENLRPLVSRLRIEPQPGLCKLSNIQHIQTPIEGTLTGHHNLLSVVEALHPTPALGGRPRRTALDIINQSEPIERGWYGSPIGWLDHQHNGAFAVAIRSAVSVGRESMLFAGAGIVADSEPEREWRETQLKFRPLMDALGAVETESK